MVKLSEIIETKTGGCSKCFSITYKLPCKIDKQLADFLAGFGKPIYDLNVVKLIKIDAHNGFHIEGRIDTKTIKLTMPKKYEKMPADKIKEKQMFEEDIIDWISLKLNIDVEIG